ncbi:MAG TPA: hypothetical protein VG028_13150 [Terriglobia bacterium]|nr:hypothetical protein [Terriglobia bacterium]
MARLIEAVDDQKRLLEHLTRNPGQPSSADGLTQIASLQPAIPVVTSAAGGDVTKVALASPPSSGPTSATQVELQAYTQKVDTLTASVDDLVHSLAGFKFSGDFRLRSDGVFRTDNSVAAPVQSAQGRYRLRFNIDRAWNKQFDFHFTVASGRFDNGLTSDSDFAGFDAKAPIFLNEASVGYRPSAHFHLRGGKMSEVFSDDSRFLFKEEIRFNGFQEIVDLPVASNPLGVTNIEFRGGQHVLTNPNLTVLPAASQCNLAPPVTPPRIVPN